MISSIPGRRSRYPPPPGEIVWSGIHHIWGRPHTTIYGGRRPNCVLAHTVSWDAYPSARSCYYGSVRTKLDV